MTEAQKIQIELDEFNAKRAVFKAANTKPKFELDSITSILSPSQIDQWQETRAKVIASLQIERHRAANDAYILHKTWQHIGAPSK